jgi:hypothetical protein
VSSRKSRQAKDQIEAGISLIQQPVEFNLEPELPENGTPDLGVPNEPECD